MNTKILLTLLALTSVAWNATSAEAASRSRREAEEPPPPPQFRVDAPTRAIALTLVKSGLPTASTIGKFSVGCGLIDSLNGRRAPIVLHPSDAFGRMRPGDFTGLFATEANAAGYRIADTEKGNLFQSENATHAELEIGANITQLTANGCFGMVVIVRMAEVETTITVDWQVFDPLEKKLLFRGTSTGHAELKNNEYNDTIVEEGTRAAFRDAAKIIVADPEFVAAVTDRRGAQVSATDQPSTAVTGVQIARLLLHTKSFNEQVTELQNQVVSILTPRATGSGFFIADGLLLTNEHVIEGFTDVKIRFLSGRELPARVISSNARRDIALLQSEGAGVDGLPINLEKPALTAQVFVIGSPLDPKYAGSISAGIVSAFRDHEYGPMIQSDVAVTHGNSGGPMFDNNGNVIALTDLGIPGQDGEPTAVNLFIPIGDALKVLNIDLALQPGGKPVVMNAPAAQAPTQTALAAPLAVQPSSQQIAVTMFPAAGPVKDGGHSGAITGAMEGTGASGAFTFTRPDGINCNGRWTKLPGKPQSGSLIDKYQKETGLPADATGMTANLAIGACSNSASFQAEYYAVPGSNSGFGVATDSDGNVYKIIF